MVSLHDPLAIGYLVFLRSDILRVEGGWGGGGVSPDKKNQRVLKKTKIWGGGGGGVP